MEVWDIIACLDAFNGIFRGSALLSSLQSHILINKRAGEARGSGGSGCRRSRAATQSGCLPADHSSESISSTSDDFRKNNDCVYILTVLRQAVLSLIRPLFWINSLHGPANLTIQTSHPSLSCLKLTNEFKMNRDKMKTALFLYASLNKTPLMTVYTVFPKVSLSTIANSVVPLCYMEHFIVYQLIGFGFTASNSFTITKQHCHKTVKRQLLVKKNLEVT